MGKFVGVKEIRQLGSFLQIVLPAIVDAQLLIGAGTFGLNQDYAVGSARTVHSSGSGILEHGDALDVVGVKIGQSGLAVGGIGAESWHAIDYEQWVGVDASDVHV